MQSVKEKRKNRCGKNGLTFILTSTREWDRSLIYVSLLAVPINIAIPLFTTFFSKYIVDLASEREDIYHLAGCVFVFCLLLLILNICDVFSKVKKKYQSIALRLFFMSKIANKVIQTDYSNIESPKGQDQVEKNIDSLSWGDSYAQRAFEQISQMLSGLGGLILYSAIIFNLSPSLVLLLILVSLISYFSQNSVNSWEYLHRNDWAPCDRKLNYILNKANDYNVAKDVRIFNLDKWFAEKFNETMSERKYWYKRCAFKQLIASIISGILVFIRDGSAYLFLIWKGMSGDLSSGDFVFYFGLILNYSTMMMDFMTAFSDLHATSNGATDFKEFLYMPDSFGCKDGMTMEVRPYSITFEHVTFSYPGTDKKILDDINLEIKKGEKAGIVGLNGAGKTTLIKLLCGLYLPSEGEIKIDGKNIQEYERDEYYKLISAVFQDIYLLPLSLYENISLTPIEEIDWDKMELVLQMSGLTEKVNSLKQRGNTKLMKSVYDEAVDLSGGEKQKLALARALYKNGGILVLDEPTASFDPIAESDIYKQYNDMTKGKTSVFISHRLASTLFCDKIYYLKNGRIMEEGNHKELMQCGGEYAHLFELQSRYYKKGENKDNETK